MFGTRLPVRCGVGGVQGPPGARPEPAEHDAGLQLGLGVAARRHAAVAHVSAGPHRHGAQLPHPPRQQPVLPLALCNTQTEVSVSSRAANDPRPLLTLSSANALQTYVCKCAPPIGWRAHHWIGPYSTRPDPYSFFFWSTGWEVISNRCSHSSMQQLGSS